MTQRITGQRFRQKKLSVKQNLAILREHEVDKTVVDDDAQRHIPKVETGVEKGEEIEHHLQAVISAAQTGGKIASLYIPTPETAQSKLEYERLYPTRFQQPATYIRFSSTVEDSTGCPYCMDADDDAILKAFNNKKSRAAQCSEDQFEEVMNFFEETAASKQPFAAVDNPPVVTFDEMESSYDDTIEESSRRFAKDIYDHWKNQRLKRGNTQLMSTLKFERNVETDDSDPYVCFRRREVRQARKTRGQGAQQAEKLKKLRHELEQARHILHLVKQREVMKLEQLRLDRSIFEQRHKVKEMKRNLGIKGDDEDLINQKPAPKPKPKLDNAALQRGMPGTGLKTPLARPDGRLADPEVVYLEDTKAKAAAELQRYIEESADKHRRWNQGWNDQTWRPITPPLEDIPRSSFRSAIAASLPTPPASDSSGGAADDAENVVPRDLRDDERPSKQMKLPIRYASPASDAMIHPQTAYRKRISPRGGRLIVDRKPLVPPDPADFLDVDERVLDRYRYEEESDDETPVYPVDPYDATHIRYRFSFYPSPSAHRADVAALQAAQAAQAKRMLGDAASAGNSAQTAPMITVRPPSQAPAGAAG